MAGIPWSGKETMFIKDKTKEGLTPKDISKQMMKEIKCARTPHSIRLKLQSMGVTPVLIAQPPDLSQEEAVEEFTTKDKLRKTKRQLDEALRSLNHQNQILDMGQKHLSSLPPVKQPKFPAAKGRTVEDAVLMLSDIHYGEIVRLSEMGGINEYNREVANLRLKAIAETITDLVTNKLSGYKFETLHIFGLGDWVSGTIHEELNENMDGNIITCCIDLAYIVAQMMRELLMVFPKISFTGVVGNHGRLKKKPYFKERYVNWDYMCYQFLSTLLSQEIAAKRVEFDVPQSFWRLKEIRGKHWLILHGDNIKGWMGIPLYGIVRAVSNLRQLLSLQQQDFDYFAMGHFHNSGLVDQTRGELVLNGSVMGGDEYAMGKLFVASKACQHFLGAHERGMTWRYPIDVQDRAIKGDPYLTAGIDERSVGEL